MSVETVAECSCTREAILAHKGVSCECGQIDRPHHHRGAPRERKIVCAVCKKVCERTMPSASHPPIDPCPFCGDKGAELMEDPLAGDATEYWVECNACGAHGPTARIGCRDDEFEDIADPDAVLELEAITMWNKRGEHLEDEE